jgi:tripartite-type tricarboxylate transporter receptor subunit TctC
VYGLSALLFGEITVKDGAVEQKNFDTYNLMRLQVTFDPLPSSMQHIRTGKLRSLAVTTATRLEMLPDISPVCEFVPGYEASSWFGIGVPRGTPPEIIERLSREITAGLANPSIRVRLAEVGTTPMLLTSTEFGVFITEETEKWAKVIRTANIKPE